MINNQAAAAERGQAARVLEHIGVVALAAVLVVGIAIAGWGDQLRAVTAQAICAVTPHPDCARDAAPGE